MTALVLLLSRALSTRAIRNAVDRHGSGGAQTFVSAFFSRMTVGGGERFFARTIKLRKLGLSAACAALLPAFVCLAASAAGADPATAAHLRDQALGDDTAWNILESLTTEIGPRPAGSPAAAVPVTGAWRS